MTIYAAGGTRHPADAGGDGSQHAIALGGMHGFSGRESVVHRKILLAKRDSCGIV